VVEEMDWRRLGILLVVLAVAVAFWDSPVVFPLKALTVLFHELGHGLAAVATGGEIISIEVSADLGGVCHHRGGVPLVVLPAGYLGSMAWGAFILLVAARTRLDRLLSFLLGVFFIAMTLVYVRGPFGSLLGATWGLGFAALGLKGSERMNDLLLQIVGITSMLYAVVDIKEDLIERTVAGSDAWKFAQAAGGTPALWGVAWIAFAIAATAIVLRIALAPEVMPPSTRSLTDS
jgi:hypothetical protein